MYCDIFRNDSRFATKVLFVIDARVPNFFKGSQRGKFQTASLGFSSMNYDIIQKRTFNVTLPSSVTKKIRKEKKMTANHKTAAPKDLTVVDV